MGREASERSTVDEKRPFERFQETVKNLLRVPKEEVDEALKAHEEQKRTKRKRTN